MISQQILLIWLPRLKTVIPGCDVVDVALVADVDPAVLVGDASEVVVGDALLVDGEEMP